MWNLHIFPVLLSQLILSILAYIVFIHIRKSSFDMKEASLIIFLNTMVNFLTFSLIPIPIAATIIYNLIAAVIMTIAAYVKLRILSLCAFYSILSVVSVLLAANLTNMFISFAHIAISEDIPIGTDAYTEHFGVSSIVYIVSVFLISIFISRWIGKFLNKRIAVFDIILQERLGFYLLLGVGIALMVFLIHTFLRYIVTDFAILTIIYAVVQIVGFGYFTIAIFALTNNTRAELELQHKDELLHSISNYAEQLDAALARANVFQHDHKNLMLGFRTHLDNRDYDNLRRCYESYMEEFLTETNASGEFFGTMSKVQTPEIKGSLMTKCLQAKALEINLSVTIPEFISVNSDNKFIVLDVCRIIGIFMDNAIEACHGVEKALIEVFAANEDGSVCFIIKNTCTTPQLDKNAIYKKGFTTKKYGKGLGLHSVERIVNNNPGIVIDTTITSKTFTQKFWVKQQHTE